MNSSNVSSWSNETAYLCTGLLSDGEVPNLLNITQLVNINSLALASLSQSSNTICGKLQDVRKDAH